MVSNKNEFIKTFLPHNVAEISFAQIDLDISDLSISDILRNINKAFPKNSRNRNSITSGNMIVSVLCKSELLYPVSGLLLVVAGSDINIELISKNYIIISVSEDKITNDDNIKLILDNITKYLVGNFKDILKNFNDFYIKFVYDLYENESSGYDI
jgi:hypothetical protein